MTDIGPVDLESILESADNNKVVSIIKDIAPGLDLAKGDAKTLATTLKLIEMYERMLEGAGTGRWFVPGTPFGIEHCPKHKLFFDSGKDYYERIFIASNRTGKSVAGAFETACHLTGEYPEWWEGKRFDRPIKAWAAGSDAKSTRDTAQKELIGPIGAWGTGMIPESKLGKWWALSGVPQGIDTIQVKHVSGGWSTVSFKNYQQEIKAFYGTAMDVIWLDEECPDNIYNECLLRTMTTEGIVFVTFTPLHGLTPLVVKFYSRADLLGGAKALAGIASPEKFEEAEGYTARLEKRKVAKAIINAGWDDAPWLSEESKARMLDDTPPHLRGARSRGEPAMGSGNVYPIPLQDILVEPFEIPAFYEKLYALDVGWNRTAVLWAARNPDTDVIYIYDEHYQGEQHPSVHAEAIRGRGKWMTGVIDPAARGRSQVDGKQLISTYRDLGLLLLPANNEVEGGIVNVWNRLSTGKLKVFKNLHNFQREYVLYRRDLNGKIVKEHDHLMDCLRYTVNNIQRAESYQNHTTNYGGGGIKYNGNRKYDI